MRSCVSIDGSKESSAGCLYWVRKVWMFGWAFALDMQVYFFITPNYIEVDRSESEAWYLLWILDKEKAKDIWILVLSLFDLRVSSVSQGESAVGHWGRVRWYRRGQLCPWNVWRVWVWFSSKGLRASRKPARWILEFEWLGAQDHQARGGEAACKALLLKSWL